MRGHIFLSVIAFTLLCALQTQHTSAIGLNTKRDTLFRPRAVIDDEASFDTWYNPLGSQDPDPEEQEQAFEKRDKYSKLKSCSVSDDCPSDRYCSSKRHKCFKRLKKGKTCCRGAGCNMPRDHICASGYCGRRTHRCASQKTNGRKCFNADDACQSHYCNSASQTCRDKAPDGGPCSENKGCKSNICSSSGTCVTKSQTTPPVPTPTESGH